MQKRNITILSASFAALFLTGVSTAYAEKTTRPGGEGTAHCEHCHGVGGCEPLTGLMPKLCGQNKEYLEMTLMQFRENTRPSPIMQQTTKSMSDELIKELSDYFANTQPSGK